MKYKIVYTILTICLFYGCGTNIVRIDRPTSTVSLESAKAVYMTGERLELRVTVSASQAEICILDGLYLTHWGDRIYQDPNFGGEGGICSREETKVGESFIFSKPMSKWSVVPFVVLEFEILDLYESDEYGGYYIEDVPNKKELISITPDQCWHGTRVVSDTMLKNFSKPGRYSFRATLNQPNHWTNAIKGVSSPPIVIEIKNP